MAELEQQTDAVIKDYNMKHPFVLQSTVTTTIDTPTVDEIIERAEEMMKDPLYSFNI